MTTTIDSIDYPDELAEAALELKGITEGFLRGLMKAGVPGEMHAEMLGELYAEMPKLLKQVMGYQIADKARRDWEAVHLGPEGDYVALEGARVIERHLYDPEKHGPKAE